MPLLRRGLRAATPLVVVAAALELPVLYRGGGTVVIDKPAGLSSEQRDSAGESVLSLVRKEYPLAKLPHRLDRLTSGVLVVATDAEALRAHNAAVAQGRWGPKVYVARLSRAVEVGERKAYLRRRGRRAEVVRSGGKPSFLDVLYVSPPRADQSRRRGRRKEDGVVDAVVLLRTGRYHQIRAMMAHEGAPVLGDALYGGGDDVPPLLCHALLGIPTAAEALKQQLPNAAAAAEHLLEQKDRGEEENIRDTFLYIRSRRYESTFSRGAVSYVNSRWI